MNIPLPIFFLFTYLNLYADICNADFQNNEAIYTSVKEYINTNLPADQEREIELSTLDPRLKLNQCPNPLEIFTHDRHLKPGRNSIGIRCNSGQAWSLYLTVTIKIFQNVVIATQALNRGDIINETYLAMQKTDISLLKSGFITDINTALNKQTLHNLAANSVLNIKDFAKATIIKRGDTVIITSGNPAVTIEMQGIAMMNGVEGQSIRIKNTSSGRIISAIVLKPGIVLVNY